MEPIIAILYATFSAKFLLKYSFKNKITDFYRIKLARFSALLNQRVKSLFCASLLLICLSARIFAQSHSLIHAHAHNDYKHVHPLNDALENGFTSVEADVFLIHKKMIVSHLRPIFKKKNTLENLYLKPLLDLYIKNDSSIFLEKNQSLILLIDIKTNASETYQALKPLFEKYKVLLTSVENNAIQKGAVTIILSGNKPYRDLEKETNRFAFIDESLLALENNNTKSLCLMSSTKYSNILKWSGKGLVPDIEKQLLLDKVELAHKQGKIVRLWASPENEIVWKFLLDCEVDLINTDELVHLKNFLLKNEMH